MSDLQLVRAFADAEQQILALREQRSELATALKAMIGLWDTRHDSAAHYDANTTLAFARKALARTPEGQRDATSNR